MRVTMMDRRGFLGTVAAGATLAGAMPAFAAAEPVAVAAAPVLPPVQAQYLPQQVRVRRDLPAGSIYVLSDKYFLYHILQPGVAMRYGVAVGRGELKFRGNAVVARKVEWPSWRPTPEMIARSPGHYAKYADGMPGGPTNPLGARAMYLYQDGRDTAIRIHGTTEPQSIGSSVSNGCIRMVNEHVMALYDQVAIGTPVMVF
ncbi:L,D-transpeptidase [Frigidibacter sp. MR17.14]|uniref:L,D-transpeptidase n=1 Tax=Frigidibacter sp. MR17.14 TaxID=3126509 RepID=UPI003012DE8D